MKVVVTAWTRTDPLLDADLTIPGGDSFPTSEFGPLRIGRGAPNHMPVWSRRDAPFAATRHLPDLAISAISNNEERRTRTRHSRGVARPTAITLIES